MVVKKEDDDYTSLRSMVCGFVNGMDEFTLRRIEDNLCYSFIWDGAWRFSSEGSDYNSDQIKFIDSVLLLLNFGEVGKDV